MNNQEMWALVSREKSQLNSHLQTLEEVIKIQSVDALLVVLNSLVRITDDMQSLAVDHG